MAVVVVFNEARVVCLSRHSLLGEAQAYALGYNAAASAVGAVARFALVWTSLVEVEAAVCSRWGLVRGGQLHRELAEALRHVAATVAR